MDPITIGLMIAGAALTAHGQNQALKKQNRISVNNQQQLLDSRNEATDLAMRRAMAFAPEERQTRQDEIAQQLEAQFQPAVQGTPVTAQGVQVGSTIPSSAASNDYLAAQAREKSKTTESLRSLAQLMGRIGSAGQLRQNEAVDLGDTANAIGRIQSGAQNLSDIEGIRASAVTPSLGTQLVGGAMSAYGAGRMATAGVGSAANQSQFGTYAAPNLRAVNSGGALRWN